MSNCNIKIILIFIACFWLTSCNTVEPPPPSIQPIDEIPSDRYPDWSPTGEWIAYEHEAVDFENDTSGIYIIRPDGTNKHLIIPGGYHPSWSPDGNKIVFSATTLDGQIWIYDLERKLYRKLTKEGFNIEPAWSNSGDKIAYITGISNRELSIVDTNNSIIEKKNFARTPSWSPNEDSICYIGNSSKLTVLEISNLSTEEFIVVDNPNWSPVSNEIVYNIYNYSLKESEIFIYNLNSRENNRLNIHDGYTPCWSSDGNKIVYSKNIGEKIILFIINKDGSNNNQLTN